MAIVTVSTSNTFNEWRVVTNQLVTEVNKTESGTAVLVANTITANTITANSDVTVSGNTSITGTLGVTGNVTLAGELRGPATFTIDPAAVGDNTGTVVIKGNLQVDGSTTTINSTTLTVDDKNIVVASGAADNAAADGAGLVVDGSNASITYLSTGDKFNVNKALELNSTLSVAGNTNFDTGTLFIDTANDRVGIGTTSPSVRLHVNLSSSSEIDVARFQASNGADIQFLDIGSDPTNNQVTFDVTGSSSGNYLFRSGGTDRAIFTSAGRFGFNTTNTDNGTINVLSSGTANAYSLYVGNVDGTYNPYIRLYHDADGIKLIQSSTYGGSASHLQFEIGGVHSLSLKPGETIFNEGGADQDFRVESDTNTHAFFVDAGAERVGLGVSNPGTKLDIGSAAGSGITMRYDSSTDYRALITPYWNSGTDTRIDFAINNTSGQTPSVYMSVGYDGGKVGIGTTVPARLLTLKGTNSSIQLTDSVAGNDVQAGGLIQYQTTNQQLAIRTYDTASGNGAISFQTGGAYEKMRITNTGRVGIGITDPLTTTHIVTGSANGLVIDPTYYGSGGGESALADSANTVYNLTLRSAYGVNAASVSNGGHKWGILLTGYNGSSVGASQLAKSAGLFAVSEETDAGYNRKVGMSLWTSPFDGNIAERVRITHEGKVGIGKTNPSQILDVNGTVAIGTTTGAGFINLGTSSGVSQYQYINFGGATAGDDAWQIGRSPAGGVSSNAFYIYDLKNNVNRVALANTGFFGIGTTSPGARLNVVDSGTANTSITDVVRVFYSATNTPTVGYGAGIAFQTAHSSIPGSPQTRVVIAGVAESVTTSSEKTALVVTTPASAGSGSQTERFRITSDGRVGIAATSPSNILTVQADGTGASFADDGVGQLVIRGSSNTSKRLGLGIDTTNNRGVIQAQLYGTGTYPLLLNPAGGSVMVGTTTEAGALTVSGKIRSLSGDIEVDTGQITTNSTSNPLKLGVNGAEKVRITSAGRLGIGTTSPSYALHVVGDIYHTGNRVDPNGYKTVNFRVGDRGNTITRCELAQITRDINDWGYAYFEVIVRHSYYNSGGYSRYQISYGYASAGVISCLDAEGQSPVRVYLGSEVTVSGDIRYRPVYVDLPAYYIVDVQFVYSTGISEIGAGTTFTGYDQIKFPLTYSDGSGSGNFNYYTTRHVFGGGMAIGTTAPTGWGTGSNLLVLAGSSGGTYVDSAGTTLTIDGNGTNTPITFYARYSNNFKIQSDSFITFGTGSSPAERVRITSTGAVGIGTTAPGAPLQVHVSRTSSTSAATIILSDSVTGSQTNGVYKSIQSISNGGSSISEIRFIESDGTNNNTALGFVTAPTAGSLIERMRITNDGSVGIGTTTPSYRLTMRGGSGMGFQMENSDDESRGFRILTTGPTTRNVFLTTTSSLYPMRFGIDSGEKMRIDTNGYVGVGTTSPATALHVSTSGAHGILLGQDTSTSANSARLFFAQETTTWCILNTGGGFSIRSGATAGSDSGTEKFSLNTSGNLSITGTLTENSSIALKENVNPITNALDYISQLVGVTYDRKDGSAKNRAGLIKEEVEKVLPNVVNDNGIQYTNIIAYLVESIKDLKKEIEDLKKGN